MRAIGLNTLSLMAGLLFLGACQSTDKASLGQNKQANSNTTNLISQARPITFVGPRAGEGYFSADGRELIFQSERERGNPFYQIYLKDLTTGNTKRLSPGFGKTTCAWIHPKEKRAMFASTHLDPKARDKQKAELDFRRSGQQKRYSWDYDEHYDIFEVQTATGALKRLTKELGYDAEGSYSPDGQWIAFASNRSGFTESLNAEDAKRFKDDPAYMMDIYIMRADGTGVKRLTTTKGYDGGPFFSPDGRRLTWRRFTPDGHMAEVYTMNVDGSDQRQLTKLKAMSWAPFYHPSGDYLIFTTNVHGYQNFELYLVDAKGERDPIRVTDLEGFDGLPVFTPDGKNLSWSRRGAQGDSQIYLANWNDVEARRLLGLPASNWRGPDQPKVIDPAPMEVTEADGRRWISYLSSADLKGRATGSAAEEQYMKSLGDQFSALGLRPLQKKFNQAFEFISGVELGEHNLLRLEMDSTPEVEVGKDWLPLSFSRSGSIGAAPVALVGYGLVAPSEGSLAAFDSYQSADVKDKWVMLFRYVPEKVESQRRIHLQRYSRLEHKVMMARERGAKGVLIVTGPTSGAKQDLIPLKLDRGSSSSSSLPVISISDALAEKLLKTSGKSLKKWQEHFDQGATDSLNQIEGLKVAAHVEVKTKTATASSLVGVLSVPGASKTIYIGAHGDHLGQGYSESSLSRDKSDSQIHFGADDNASGVAAVLEIARYFSRPEVRRGLKYNIAFAVWSGEELGNLGSTSFLNSLSRKERESIVAYLNMDMIGRYQDKLLVQGLGSSRAWAEWIERRASSTDLVLHAQSDPYLPTDSMAFYVAGIPTLTFFTGAHIDYHTPNDTSEKINFPAWVKITTLVAGLARDLAVKAAKLPYEKVERQKMPSGGGRGFRIFLGTIPDYSQEKSSGVKLSGVIKGGPAEKAGLKSGDVIVGISGLKIESIQDYVYSLQSIKPNEATKITVLRAGEKLDLDITPVARE